MDFPHGVTVTLVSTTTTTDDLGDSTEVTTETRWGPVAISPRYATESSDPRTAPVMVGLELMGPTRSIDSDDLIRIPAGNFYAGTWQVDGLPANYDHPMTGWQPGMVVPVKRASAV